MNKSNENKHTGNGFLVTRRKWGWGTAKWVKAVNCMVMDGNSTSGGKYTVVNTEVEI